MSRLAVVAVAAAVLLARGARADVISPPEAACNRAKPGDSCRLDGLCGICEPWYTGPHCLGSYRNGCNLANTEAACAGLNEAWECHWGEEDPDERDTSCEKLHPCPKLPESTRSMRAEWFAVPVIAVGVIGALSVAWRRRRNGAGR